MKNAVIFDMDGVLVDNSPIHLEAFIIFCQRYDIDMDAEKLKPYFGMGNEDIIPKVFGRSDMTIEEINQKAEEKEQIYREIFSERIKPLDGLIPLMKALKNRGVKIAIGSSGMRKNVDFVVEKCAIAEYIDAIADGDQVRRAKPDPEVFLLAAKKLGVEPKDALVFEDSFAGVKAARNAGMNVVVLTTTYKKEEHKDYDYIISDFTEVDASIIDKF